MAARRILIVEDDDNLRQVMQIQLNRDGFQTTSVPDVAPAMDVLEHSPQDLLITDLNLPASSGIELLKRVRAEHPDTTVIVMTAFGTVETAVEAMKLGAY